MASAGRLGAQVALVLVLVLVSVLVSMLLAGSCCCSCCCWKSAGVGVLSRSMIHARWGCEGQAGREGLRQWWLVVDVWWHGCAAAV